MFRTLFAHPLLIYQHFYLKSAVGPFAWALLGRQCISQRTPSSAAGSGECARGTEDKAKTDPEQFRAPKSTTLRRNEGAPPKSSAPWKVSMLTATYLGGVILKLFFLFRKSRACGINRALIVMIYGAL